MVANPVADIEHSVWCQGPGDTGLEGTERERGAASGKYPVCVDITGYNYGQQREDAALRAVEEIKLKEDKKRRQRDNKMALDYSLKLKMKQRAKEVQEELAFDMKLLEQMLTEHTNETQDNLQHKVEPHS